MMDRESNGKSRVRHISVEIRLCLAQVVMVLALGAVWGDDGCVLHLPLDEPAGARCEDRSGKGNHAEILTGRRVHDDSGGALVAAKPEGQAEARPYGRAAVVKAGPSLRFPSEVTVSAWVRLDGEPKDMDGPWPSILFKFAPGARGFRLGFIRDANAAFLKWGDGSSPHGYGLRSKKKTWERGWHHLVGIVSSTPALYIDGELDSRTQMKGGFEDRDSDVILGCDGLVGTVDEVRLFNRALTEPEVQALYAAMLPIAGGKAMRRAPVTAAAAEAEPGRPAPVENLIPGDSGFESGIDHHWEKNAAARVKTAAHGSACVKLDGPKGNAYFETSDITVDPNRTYTFSAFVRGKGRVTLRIVTVNPDDPYNGNWRKSQSFPLTDTWQRRHVTLETGWNWTGKWSRVARSGHKFRASVAVGSGSECEVDSIQFEAGQRPGDYVPSRQAGVTLSSGKPGNVLLVGEPRELAVDVYAAGRKSVTLCYTVAAWGGEALAAATERIPLDADAVGRHALRLPGDRKGFFIVRARIEDEGRVLAETDFTFCVVDPPRRIPAREAFFGLQGFLTEEWAEAARRIGVQWYRLGTPWTWTERKKGEFNWERRDKHVALLEAKGISIMGLFSGTPPWAVVPAPKDDYRKWAYPPRDMKDLETFVEKLTARYRGRIGAFEFWNEPYGGFFAIPPDWKRTKGQVFAEMMKAAYRGAKKGNPDCKICINPTGCDMLAQGRNDFVNDVLANAPDAFDIFNHHPYTSPVSFGVVKVRSPEAFKMVELMDMTRDMLKTKARGQEIWNSEQGYTLDLDAPPDGSYAMDYAKYVVRSYLLQRAASIGRVFWFKNYDRRLSNNRKGMWRGGKQPLPVVAAYAAAAQAFDGAGRVRKLAVGEDVPGLYAYAFKMGQGGMVALWLAEPPSASPILAFAAPGSVEALDLMGNPMPEATLDAGRLSLPISDSPVYLTAKDVPWERLAAAVEAGNISLPPLSLAVRISRSQRAEVVASNLTEGEIRGELTVGVRYGGQEAREQALKLQLAPKQTQAIGVKIDANRLGDRLTIAAQAETPGQPRPVRTEREFRLLPCPRAKSVKVDGNLADWPSPPAEGRPAAMWDDERLYLAARAGRSPGAGTAAGSRMRLGDCLSLDLSVPEVDESAQEVLVGCPSAVGQAFRARAGKAFEIGVLSRAEVAVGKAGEEAVYEVAIPFAEILPTGADPATTIELSVRSIAGGRPRALAGPVLLIRRP